MKKITIRLPDDKHARIKFLAEQRQVSINKLFEEFSTMAISEFDAENRFKALAATGSAERGLDTLAKLDQYFSA